MTHARTQIRNAVSSALTGLATTGSNVYQSRVYPIGEDQLPGLTVHTVREGQELMSRTSSGAKVKRVAELAVGAYVKDGSNYDTIVDTIMVEVEEALQGDATLQALVKFITPRDLDIDFNGDGDIPVAIATQVFDIEYHTLIDDVETVV